MGINLVMFFDPWNSFILDCLRFRILVRYPIVRCSVSLLLLLLLPLFIRWLSMYGSRCFYDSNSVKFKLNKSTSTLLTNKWVNKYDESFLGEVSPWSETSSLFPEHPTPDTIAFRTRARCGLGSDHQRVKNAIRRIVIFQWEALSRLWSTGACFHFSYEQIAILVLNAVLIYNFFYHCIYLYT